MSFDINLVKNFDLGDVSYVIIFGDSASNRSFWPLNNILV
jgi:hypothetical protein